MIRKIVDRNFVLMVLAGCSAPLIHAGAGCVADKRDAVPVGCELSGPCAAPGTASRTGRPIQAKVS